MSFYYFPETEFDKQIQQDSKNRTKKRKLGLKDTDIELYYIDDITVYLYCVDGAELECCYGSQTVKFHVEPDKRSTQSKKPLGIRIDNQKINIPNFGQCSVNENYNLGSLFSSGSILNFANINNVKKNETGECIAKQFMKWLNYMENVYTGSYINIITGEGDKEERLKFNVLDRDDVSFTFCEYGGKIKFTTSGQLGSEGALLLQENENKRRALLGLPPLAPSTAEDIIANKLKQDMLIYEGETPTNENEFVFNAIMKISTQYRNRDKFSYSVMKEKEAQKLADNYLIVKNYIETSTPRSNKGTKEERKVWDKKAQEASKAYGYILDNAPSSYSAWSVNIGGAPIRMYDPQSGYMGFRINDLSPPSQEKLDQYFEEAIYTKSTSIAKNIIDGVDQVATMIAFSYMMDNMPAYGDNIVSDGHNASLNKKPTLGLITEDVSGGKNSFVVTEEAIREAMKDAPLKTQQSAVSLPAIQRYVDRLLAGEVAPPIRVDNGTIVDGNHRYIAGRLVGIEPEQQPYLGANENRIIGWNDVKIDPFDWGNN